MTDINKVIIRGRAAADASVKHLTNSALVTLRVGTDGSYTGRDGRKVERVDWHNVACWGDVCEQAQSIRKGDVVQVEGQLRTRSCRRDLTPDEKNELMSIMERGQRHWTRKDGR